ncbi:heavy metal translocating P-type ATPase [Psychrobium sp. nBUS_13]|uniref:heavy metal translocating P-type ATPase n=1 Tax=Psychrobium sp. nBUS_13 TaxID=3395319 RepID=UPI003EBA56C9
MSENLTVKYSLSIGGLRCNNCVNGLNKKLNQLADVHANVSFTNEQAQFECQPSKLYEVIDTIVGAGYQLIHTQETYSITGWRCGGCANKTKEKLSKITGLTNVSANSTLNQLSLERNNDLVSQSQVIQALSDQGYQAQLKSDLQSSPKRTEQPWRLIAATLLTLPLITPMFAMLFSIEFMLIGWLEFVLGTLVQFVIGAPFYRGALQSLKNKAANMDTLVVLGTSAAYFYSCYLLFWLGREGGLYFESSAVIITFISIGKWLEDRAKKSAGDAMVSLIALKAQTANVVANGAITRIAIEDVQEGAIVRVMAGAKVPVDGTIINGKSEFNESFISGEHLPVAKTIGDEVFAGAVNGHAVIELKVSAIGSASNLGQIIAMVEQAQSTKAPIERLVDKVAAWFVPIVLMIAAATFISWLIAGVSFEIALINSVAVLVVACPCALGLATPAAIVVGTGLAAKQGIVLRDPKALQIAGTIQKVVFDKTGTLTIGQPQVTDYHWFTKTPMLNELKALISNSDHPLSLSIARQPWLEDASVIESSSIEVIAGQGIIADIGEQRFFLGNRQLLEKHGVTLSMLTEIPNGSEVLFANSEGVLAQFILEDSLRAQSNEAVVQLAKLDISSVLLSGDNQQSVDLVAQSLSITEHYAQQTPFQKQHYLTKNQEVGVRIAMVGDGINDAPALAQADLGIAMGGGTQTAISSAQITLMQDNPRLVATAIDIARKTWQTVKQNLWLAFMFNTVAIPAAALGYLSPQLAGLAMALSSVTVLGNALYLKYQG